MNTEQIKDMQRRVGVMADGFWGPKSMAACQAHLRQLMAGHQWPGATQRELTDFYGLPGDESRLVNLDVQGLGVKYEGSPVKTIRCHGKVAGSLRAILQELQTVAPGVLAQYDGCYANRAMRGGSLPSLHARGAAIDFDAVNNGNTAHWPVKAVMPLAVMEVFARHGWLSAGAFWGRDAMHFQATR